LKHLPLIGITMGDPAGIGPEIIAMALADRSVYECCRPVVLGDPGVLSSIICNLPPLIPKEVSLNIIASPAQARAMPGVIDLIAISELKPGIIQPGRPAVRGQGHGGLYRQGGGNGHAGRDWAMVTVSDQQGVGCIRPDIFMTGIRN